MKAAGAPPAARKAIEGDWLELTAQIVSLEALTDAGVATTEDRKVWTRLRRDREKLELRVTAATEAPAEELPAVDATDRRRFCELHLTTPDGGPFDLKGREWQKTQLWDVLDGYKLWPVDRGHLCKACARRVGTFTPSVHDADESRSPDHAKAAGGCLGLHSHIVWLVCLQLKRQQGKTTAFAGYAVSSMFRQGRESYAYVAGSEDQSEHLVSKNFTKPMSPAIVDRLKIGRTGFSNLEAYSDFQLFPTSLAGATGGTRTVVGVDEARDVPDEVFAAFVPQVYARNGWRCPHGHSRSVGDLALLEDREGTAVDPDQERYSQTCNVCGARPEPFTGKVVAMSSAQELDGSTRDWFHNLCDKLEADPQPDAHVFRTTQNINPKVQAKIVSRTEALLGSVDGLKDSIDIEAGGVSKRKGDPFVTDAQVIAVEDKRLTNRDSGSRPAVAFLDTSETTELTSLVLFEDDHREDERPWHRIVEVRIDIWDPARMGGMIDESAVELHLYDIVPRFGLVSLCIDDRLRPWARALLLRLRKEAPFRGIVRGCNTGKQKWGRLERRLGWEKLDERIIGRTMRLIPNKRQREELKGARRLYDVDGGMDVREPRRRVRHLDVAEGVASCCLMIHELASKPKRTGLGEADRGAAAVVKQLRRGGRRRLAPDRDGNWY